MVLVLKAGQILACPNRNEQKEKKKNDSVCVDFADSTRAFFALNFLSLFALLSKNINLLTK